MTSVVWFFSAFFFFLGILLGMFFQKPETRPDKITKFYFGHFTGMSYSIFPRPWDNTKDLLEYHGPSLIENEYNWPVIFQAQFYDIHDADHDIEKQILDQLEV